MKFKKMWLKSDRVFAMKSGSNLHKMDKLSASVYTKPKKTDTFIWCYSGFKEMLFSFLSSLCAAFIQNIKKKNTVEFCKILFSF